MTTDNTNVNFSLNVYFDAMKYLFYNNIYFLILLDLKNFTVKITVKITV